MIDVVPLAVLDGVALPLPLIVVDALEMAVIVAETDVLDDNVTVSVLLIVVVLEASAVRVADCVDVLVVLSLAVMEFVVDSVAL